MMNQPDPQTRDSLGAVAGVRVLITGGAGLIGARVRDELQAAGAIVTVLDDLSAHEPAALTALRINRDDPDLRVGDVSDPGLVRELVAGADFVIHAAAHSTVAGRTRDPATAFRCSPPT
jgi:nucleoside-diphosphate-sugar epimerase